MVSNTFFSKDSLDSLLWIEGFSRQFQEHGVLKEAHFSRRIDMYYLLWVEGFSREFAHGVLKKGDVCSGEPLGSKTNFGVVWGGFGEPRWLKMEPRWSNMGPRWSQDGP